MAVPIRLCVTCAHHEQVARGPDLTHICHGVVSLVDGKTIIFGCETARADEKLCGQAGNHWVQSHTIGWKGHK